MSIILLRTARVSGNRCSALLAGSPLDVALGAAYVGFHGPAAGSIRVGVFACKSKARSKPVPKASFLTSDPKLPCSNSSEPPVPRELQKNILFFFSKGFPTRIFLLEQRTA